MTLANKAQIAIAAHAAEKVAGVRLKCARDGAGARHVDISSDHKIFDGPIIEVPALMEISRNTKMVLHRRSGSHMLLASGSRAKTRSRLPSGMYMLFTTT